MISKRKLLFLVDAIINLVLGVLLLAYSPGLADWIGVPIVNSSFYPNILGAIFIGISLALLVEAYGNTSNNTTGLGLIGAICINLCGGIVLLIWLLSGSLDIPLRGSIFLWTLDIILLIVSSFELFFHFKSK
jgi:hypothetical protein